MLAVLVSSDSLINLIVKGEYLPNHTGCGVKTVTFWFHIAAIFWVTEEFCRKCG